jgi:hypothetical protein
VIFWEEQRRWERGNSTHFWEILLDGREKMRLIVLMDNADILVRGWRAALAGDNAVSEEQRQGYCRVIEH